MAGMGVDVTRYKRRKATAAFSATSSLPDALAKVASESDLPNLRYPALPTRQFVEFTTCALASLRASWMKARENVDVGENHQPRDHRDLSHGDRRGGLCSRRHDGR